MAWWLVFVLFVGSTVVSSLLRRRAKEVQPSSLGDFDAPTAEEGRAIPVIAGTCFVKGPNVTWYGDLLSIAIKRKSGLFSTSVVGYKYYLGMQLAICHGPVDALLAIQADEDKPVPPQQVSYDDASAPGGDKISMWIDQRNLFGGEEKEGGIGGSFKFYYGSKTQQPNAYLSQKWGITAPALRGLCYAVMEQMYIGTTTYPKSIGFVVRRCPDPLGMGQAVANINGDCNAALWLYEILTNKVWGLRRPPSRIDEASFRAAALTLAAERFGISMTLDSPNSADQVVEEIQRHIDAVLYTDPQTSLWTLKLIRRDYSPAELPEFTADDTVAVPEFHRANWPETLNEMKVEYIERSYAGDAQTPSYDYNQLNVFEGTLNYSPVWIASGLQITPDGRYAIAAGFNSYGSGHTAFLHKIDLDNFTLAASKTDIALGEAYLEAMGLDASGNIYLLLRDPSALQCYFQKYSLATLELVAESTHASMESPVGDVPEDYHCVILPWEPGFGHYIVANGTHAFLWVLNTETMNLTTIAECYGIGLNLPNAECLGIVVDKHKDIWMLDSALTSGHQGLHRVHFAGAALSPEFTHYPQAIETEWQTFCRLSYDEANDRLIVLGTMQGDQVILNLNGTVYKSWSTTYDYGLGSLHMELDKQAAQSGQLLICGDNNYPPVIALMKAADGSITHDYTNNFYPVESNRWQAGIEPFLMVWDAARNAIVTLNLNYSPYCYSRFWLTNADVPALGPNPWYFKKRTAQAQDLANFDVRREVVSDTINFHGISRSDLAQLVAMRELKVAAYPLGRGKVTLNRKAWRLRPGSCFRWSWPPLNIAGIVLRVSEIAYGALEEGRIEATVVEDMFSVAAAGYTPPPPSGWSDPSTGEPQAVSAQRIFEAPYHLVGEKRQIVDLAARSGAMDDYAAIWTDDGAGYFSSGTLYNFTPTGVLSAAYPKGTAATDPNGLTLAAGGIDLSLLNSTDAGGLARGENLLLVDDELMSYQTVTANADGTVSISGVMRGVLDTIPADHAAGARVWFITEGMAITRTDPYSADATVAIKNQPHNSKGLLALAQAMPMSLTTASRALRPYPPGNVKVNGVSEPASITGDAVLTWAHRNRTAQTQMVAQDAASVAAGPEGTYRVQVLLNGVLKQTYSDLTGTSVTYSAQQHTADGGANPVIMRITPVNGSYEGTQRTITFNMN